MITEERLEHRKKIGWCSRTAKKLRKNITESERALRIKLLDIGFYKHRFQKFFISNDDRIYIADFYLTKKKIVIEVDGGYHFTPEQIEKDSERDKYLLSRKDVKGVLRLNNYQARKLPASKIKQLIDGMKPKECLILY